MRDTELYAQILGLRSPWRVADVVLDRLAGEVTVRVEAEPSTQWTCPKCRQASPGYDRRRRRWRHLDTMQYRTILEASVPRIECAEHGVLQVDVPWAEPGSGFTALFEALVIDWLREASMKAVSEQLGVSWNAIDGVMRRAVQRGLHRRKRERVSHVCVDETAFQKRHEYVTVVSDAERGRVLYVADERTGESLSAYYATLDGSERAAIESVSMDMWPAYIGATLTHIPDAHRKIAFDKFHVAKYLGDGVDKVRRQEHRQLLRAGDQRLKGSKYRWLTNPHRMSRTQWLDFSVLRNSALKTARAWALKEAAMDMWRYRYRAWAEQAWQRWLNWAARCRLAPMQKVAKTIKQHLWGILNAMTLGVTNATAESINSRIQKLKQRACGYRNRERFRNAIYFHLGSLDLYPRSLTAD